MCYERKLTCNKIISLYYTTHSSVLDELLECLFLSSQCCEVLLYRGTQLELPPYIILLMAGSYLFLN